jgi:hypothetical protein
MRNGDDSSSLPLRRGSLDSSTSHARPQAGGALLLDAPV